MSKSTHSVVVAVAVVVVVVAVAGADIMTKYLLLFFFFTLFSDLLEILSTVLHVFILYKELKKKWIP